MKLYIKINKKFVRVLTIAEVARRLNISRQAVLKRINAGKYRAARMRLDSDTKHNLFLIPITEVKERR